MSEDPACIRIWGANPVLSWYIRTSGTPVATEEPCYLWGPAQPGYSHRESNFWPPFFIYQNLEAEGTKVWSKEKQSRRSWRGERSHGSQAHGSHASLNNFFHCLLTPEMTFCNTTSFTLESLQAPRMSPQAPNPLINSISLHKVKFSLSSYQTHIQCLIGHVWRTGPTPPAHFLVTGLVGKWVSWIPFFSFNNSVILSNPTNTHMVVSFLDF